MPRRLAALALIIILSTVGPVAGASKAVKTTLTGCVVDGAYYSIDGRAYRISLPASFDLHPFEGKEVVLHGFLFPGDRFDPAPDARPEVKHEVCPPASLRLIKSDQVMNLRVEATKAADAGDLARAVELIAQAMALVTPADCDTFTDRAHIMVLKGDLGAAAKDVAILKARSCVVERRMNPLLLQDLGNLLGTKGEAKLAIEVLKIALEACDGDWCRPSIQKDLEAAKKK